MVLIFENIVMYIPIGAYVQMKFYYKVLAFVVFICILVLVQFILLLEINEFAKSSFYNTYK